MLAVYHAFLRLLANLNTIDRKTDEIADTTEAVRTAPLLAVSATSRELTSREADNAATMSSALLDAVREGDIEEVLSLLHQGADVDAQVTEDDSNAGEDTGFGVFHVIAEGWECDAVEENGEEMLALLCEHGANLEAVDDAGRTALHVSANHFNAEFLRILLERGANVNAVDKTQETALHKAVSPESGPFEDVMESLEPMISCLLEYGANPLAVNAEGRMASDLSFYNLPFHQDMG